MNIKQHIEAGHYERDPNGHCIVKMRGGEDALIYTTQHTAHFPIAGAVRHPEGLDGWRMVCWQVDGRSSYHSAGNHDLLPPPPRKVEVKRYGVMQRAMDPKNGPYFCTTCETFAEAEDYARRRVGGDMWFLVELTGSYEEPWS